MRWFPDGLQRHFPDNWSSGCSLLVFRCPMCAKDRRNAPPKKRPPILARGRLGGDGKSSTLLPLNPPRDHGKILGMTPQERDAESHRRNREIVGGLIRQWWLKPLAVGALLCCGVLSLLVIALMVFRLRRTSTVYADNAK